jgi:hypothetical protein
LGTIENSTLPGNMFSFLILDSEKLLMEGREARSFCSTLFDAAIV